MTVSKGDDITWNKHGGNPQSILANLLTDKGRDMARIYRHVHNCGYYGCTSDEAAVVLHMPSQTCSARFSDMKAMGLLIEKYVSGKKVTRLTRQRAPAAVCIAVRWMDPIAVEQQKQEA